MGGCGVWVGGCGWVGLGLGLGGGGGGGGGAAYEWVHRLCKVAAAVKRKIRKRLWRGAVTEIIGSNTCFASYQWWQMLWASDVLQ